jgi:hypothetical protein
MIKLEGATSRVSLNPEAHPSAPAHAHARLDRLGIWLSALCAVHCMVMPIVLILFPVMSWIRWSRAMDATAITAAAVLGLGGTLLSLRQHHDLRPLGLVLGGLTLHLVGRFAARFLGPFLSQTLIIAGPMLMGYGLWKNRQLCRCARHATLKCCGTSIVRVE